MGDIVPSIEIPSEKVTAGLDPEADRVQYVGQRQRASGSVT